LACRWTARTSRSTTGIEPEAASARLNSRNRRNTRTASRGDKTPGSSVRPSDVPSTSELDALPFRVGCVLRAWNAISRTAHKGLRALLVQVFRHRSIPLTSSAVEMRNAPGAPGAEFGGGVTPHCAPPAPAGCAERIAPDCRPAHAPKSESRASRPHAAGASRADPAQCSPPTSAAKTVCPSAMPARVGFCCAARPASNFSAANGPATNGADTHARNNRPQTPPPAAREKRNPVSPGKSELPTPKSKLEHAVAKR